MLVQAASCHVRAVWVQERVRFCTEPSAGKILEQMEHECGGESKFQKALAAGRVYQGEDGLYYARERVTGKAETKGRTQSGGSKDRPADVKKLEKFKATIRQLGWKVDKVMALDRGRFKFVFGHLSCWHVPTCPTLSWPDIVMLSKNLLSSERTRACNSCARSGGRSRQGFRARRDRWSSEAIRQGAGGHPEGQQAREGGIRASPGIPREGVQERGACHFQAAATVMSCAPRSRLYHVSHAPRSRRSTSSRAS